MSIDHFIGVFYSLRYQSLMGNTRIVKLAIVSIWLISGLTITFDSSLIAFLYLTDAKWSNSQMTFLNVGVEPTSPFPFAPEESFNTSHPSLNYSGD